MSIYHGRISRVNFSLGGSETAINDAYAEIVSDDLFKDNKPVKKGLYDASMGTTSNSFKCDTCRQSKMKCIGHPGVIPLRYPVFNNRGLSEVLKWLKVICFECSKSFLDPAKYMHLEPSQRLDHVHKTIKSQYAKGCHFCEEKHPDVTRPKKEPFRFELKWHDANKTPQIALPHYVYNIFSKIEPETVINFGRPLESHPSHLVLTHIKVISTPSRPDVKKQGGGRSTNDSLTTIYQLLIRKNEQIPQVLPTDIDPKLEKHILELSGTYYELANAKGDDAIQSIAKRIKGKQGRCRGNLLGKRTFIMGRSFITNDVTLRIDEVGIPLAFARTVQVRERVQPWNKEQVISMCMNYKKRYPAVSRVIKKDGTEMTADKAIDTLEYGDEILRDILDGDYVGFNRQPSVTISQICGHRAKVIMDPSIMTLVMNVIACANYNADFDGDAMNLIVVASSAGRNELAMLSNVSNRFISHEQSAPNMGQVDDSKIGTSELTRSATTLTKFRAMSLFGRTTYLPDFTGCKPHVTGRECYSMLLDELPINYTGVPKYYDESLKRYVTYDPTEIKTVITRGKLLSGVLDSKAISASNGSIYQLVAYEYGNHRALELLFNNQQLAIAYTLLCGLSIGIKDLMISDAIKKQIDGIVSEIIKKSDQTTMALQKGEIIPPINRTVEEFYEEQQISTLSHRDEFNEPLFGSLDFATNTFLKLFMFGSKGSLDNIRTMVTANGQKLINGERMRQTFGYKRTLAYFRRFDTSPKSRGYIANSLIAGLDSAEYVFSAMGTRSELISKALSTAETGDMNRRSTKAMESNIIHNYRYMVKDIHCMQLVYGEDYLDPTMVVNNKFETVMCSDEEFTAVYNHKEFPEYFKELKADRDKYRELFLKIEKISVNEPFTDVRKLGVNVKSVITDVCTEYSNAEFKGDLKKIVAKVEQIIASIPYVLMNEIQEAQKAAVPEYMAAACWLLQMAVRSQLHPNAIVEKRLTLATVTLIGNKIRVRYQKALIAPGTAVGIISAMSFCRPMTQYVLDAHHRSAGAGTSKGGLTMAKEAFGAKDVTVLKDPSMYVAIEAPLCYSKAKVQEIASSIEVMYFRQFVASVHIFATEEFGKPVHSRFVAHAADIAAFKKQNPLLVVPSDLTGWCTLFMIDKTTLILKNMSIETIIDRLRIANPDVYIMYTPENAPSIYIRFYYRSVFFKKEATVDSVRTAVNECLDQTIRGVPGCITAKVTFTNRSEIKPDGSVGRVKESYAISTIGTNLSEVMTVNGVDPYHTFSDAVQEMWEMFGVEASSLAIIQSLRTISGGINHRHYQTYANEMTMTGYVTPIEISGVKAREPDNILLRIGFSHVNAALEEAAINAVKSPVYGVTGPLILGDTPRIGTMYNQFLVNESFVVKNTKTAADILSAF